MDTAPRGTGTGAGLGRMWALSRVPTCSPRRRAKPPAPRSRPFPRVGMVWEEWTRRRAGCAGHSRERDRRGHTWAGTQTQTAPGPGVSVGWGCPLDAGASGLLSGAGGRASFTSPPRPLTLDHQQPWDTHAWGWGCSLCGGRSLQPRATPRATRGRRCLSTCSEDRKARQQRATPPCRAGGRPRAVGSWRQARYLILPAGQAGRHKRWTQEGRESRGEETDAERETGKMGRPADGDGGRGGQSPSPLRTRCLCPFLVPRSPTETLPLRGLCVPRVWHLEDLRAVGQVPGSLPTDPCLCRTSSQVLQARP